MTPPKPKKGSEYTPNNYVNNKEFLALIIKYKETPTDRLYNDLGKIFIKISRRYATKNNFASYTQDRIDDMISDSCVFMLTTGMKNFDPGISQNPFAFFTQIAHNAFLQYINKSKLHESRFSNLSYIDKLEEVETGSNDD